VQGDSKLELHKFCDQRKRFLILNGPKLMGQLDKCKVKGCTDESNPEKRYCDRRR
jgi:hypothetical protein